MVAIAKIPPGEYVPTADQRILWHNVPWPHFEAYLALKGDAPVPRMAFLKGTVELTSPSRSHEQIKSYIGRLIEAWAIEHRVILSPYGSWTLKDAPKEAGAEPDKCYIVGDQKKDRPDLAIEVVWTSGGIDKLEIYRRLGVREVWFWRDDRIEIFVLVDDGYDRACKSAVLPDLDVALLEQYLDRPSLVEAVMDYRRALAGDR
jgi:Uma2 family endonuclease